MKKIIENKIEIEIFLADVAKRVKEGSEYVDAMQYSALYASSAFTGLVTVAIDKYQEAIYERTALSKQGNIDECALASMGTIWHDENFEGSTEHIESSEDEIILDSLYFILKYAKCDDALKSAIRANEKVCGDIQARKRLIELAFSAN